MIDKESYMEILNYIEDSCVWAQIDEMFQYYDYNEIGQVIIASVLSVFGNTDYSILKQIICKSQYYSREQFENVSDEDLNILVSKNILGLKSFPGDEYQNLVSNYSIIQTEYCDYLNFLETEINRVNGLIDTDEENPSCSGTLIKKRDRLYSANAANKSILKDLEKIEKEYYLLDDEIQQQYVYREMLKYAKDKIEKYFDNTVFMMEEENRICELKKMAIDIAKEDGKIKEYICGFQDYKRSIESWKNATNSVLKPYFLVKMRKMHDDVENFFTDNFNGEYWNKSDELFDICKKRNDKIRETDEWIKLKVQREDVYILEIEKYISEYGVLEYIEEKTKSMFCIQKRRKILEEILLSYKDEKYVIFCNMVVVQIEGIFYDMFLDANIQNRLDGDFDLYDKDDLRKKISKNDVEMEIEEAALYFKYYFNNIIRNKVAHGRILYDVNENKMMANDLLLDLQYVIHLLDDKADTNQAIEYIDHTIKWIEFSFAHNNDMNSRYERIFNSLNDNVLANRRGNIKYVDSHQEMYWIFNPYYDEAYSFANVIIQRDKIRSYYLSEEFWEYVLGYIESYNENEIKHIRLKECFISRVRALKEYVAKNKKEILPTVCKVEEALACVSLEQ